MKPVIVLKDVKKHYKMGDSVVKAIDGISMEIRQGEFIAIMGPSGSGKSTSMNVIGSLDTPTAGEIYLDGKNIAHMGESTLAQLRGRKIGFIFQSFNLIPNLTAKENVMLPMLFQGVPLAKREETAVRLLKEVEMGHRLNNYPNQLSGGEQQRVAIARSLVNDPEVILADEPTGNLDTKTGEKVMDFLTELNNKGKTIIMITHDPELGKEHAKIIYWMKDGKINAVSRKQGKVWKDFPVK